MLASKLRLPGRHFWLGYFKRHLAREPVGRSQKQARVEPRIALAIGSRPERSTLARADCCDGLCRRTASSLGSKSTRARDDVDYVRRFHTPLRFIVRVLPPTLTRVFVLPMQFATAYMSDVTLGQYGTCCFSLDRRQLNCRSKNRLDRARAEKELVAGEAVISSVELRSRYGAQVKRHIDVRNIPVADLAALAALPKKRVKKIIAGQLVRLTLRDMSIIAGVLEVPLSDLLLPLEPPV